MELKIFLNYANLICYLRLFLLVLMFLNIRRYPFISFALCTVSGLLNTIDGSIARHLDQTSWYGAALDRTLDRLTTTFLYFHHTSYFPNYWLLFFNIGFTELMSILRDVNRKN